MNDPIIGAQIDTWTLQGIGAEKLVKELAYSSINTAVLRVFDYSDAPHPGVFFKTPKAPLKEELLKDFLETSKDYGLKVYAWMTTINMPWTLRENPEWAMVRYDWKLKKFDNNIEPRFRASPFSWEFARTLVELYSDLARYDIDGILFQDDSVIFLDEDFSLYARWLYWKEFGILLNPDNFFDNTGAPTRDCYRWASWKAHRISSLIKDIIDACRKVKPKIKFALNTYSLSLLEPENSLLWFSQDITSLQTSTLDYFFVMSYHRGIAKERNLSIEDSINLLRKMTEEGVKKIGSRSLLMKIQTKDFDTGALLPKDEIEKVKQAIVESGCENILYFPYDPQFLLVSKYLK